MLEDNETYMIIKKDSTNKLISNLHDLLVRWKNKGFINIATYRFLSFNEGSLPYGFPKVHKNNCPYRFIVSSINSPLYNIALFLHKIMVKSFPTPPSHIENSFELVKTLRKSLYGCLIR